MDGYKRRKRYKIKGEQMREEKKIEKENMKKIKKYYGHFVLLSFYTKEVVFAKCFFKMFSISSENLLHQHSRI
jgi:hypothetical protein